MKEETHEGIVLRNIAIQEGRRILTIFSPDEGILSLATPRISIHEMRLSAATTPLTRAEFTYRKGRGDIYRLLEASHLESFDGLRTQLRQLSCAGELLDLITRSQLLGKPSPLLYRLLLVYLRRLTSTKYPLLLVMSFHLKLLKHEGFFAWTHKMPSSIQELAHFSEEEWHVLGHLTDSRSFDALERIEMTPFLMEKIRLFFERVIV